MRSKRRVGGWLIFADNPSSMSEAQPDSDERGFAKARPLPYALLSKAQECAQAAGRRLELPCFETDPDSLKTSLKEAMQTSEKRLSALASLPPSRLRFENTVRELDDLLHTAHLTANRLCLIKETHPDDAMRKQAVELVKEFQAWAVGLDYREDVYQAVRAYADTRPKLKGEDKRLFEDTLRDYRRAGLRLPPTEKNEVQSLRKELAQTAADFDANITRASAVLEFSKADLDGLPQDFLDQENLLNKSRNYELRAEVVWHFMAVMENAQSETIRKRMNIARDSLAAEDNVDLLQKMLRLRASIANKLGYSSWADYKTETKMAGNGAAAIRFLKELNDGLKDKFAAEMESYRLLKVAETGDPEAAIYAWDWRYYANQLKKQRYQVDAEQLRAHFPYERVLKGMLAICEEVFGLSFARLEAPYRWINNLELYLVCDAKNQSPLGTFYLDMFPRKGKFSHFAQFSLIDGKRLPSGEYQCPCVALVCNFPPPAEGKPSLLSHNEVETLFHEFGHALHSLLTEADYFRFSGTSVPRDFVEAPSQMLENWVWDPQSLNIITTGRRGQSPKWLETKKQRLLEQWRDLRFMRSKHKTHDAVWDEKSESVVLWNHLHLYDCGMNSNGEEYYAFYVDERDPLHKEVKIRFHSNGRSSCNISKRIPAQPISNTRKKAMDSMKTIPADLIRRLKESRLSSIGSFYRRQISFGLLDLELHSAPNPQSVPDALQVSKRLFAKIFLPAPKGTAFVAGFGHLTGYDAGYYGYAWADAIAADMATVFEKSPSRYFDAVVGRRLREEIYAPGNSRDVNKSIEKFLSRSRSIQPFLESIGVPCKK